MSIDRITELGNELNRIGLAQAVFDDEGVITAMTVRSRRMTSIVSTENIPYPSTMVDAIKAAFSTRRQQIEQELESLGVTVNG